MSILKQVLKQTVMYNITSSRSKQDHLRAFFVVFVQTPLHCAAIFGSLQCVEVLLKRGAGLEVVNGAGKTPIDFASENGRVHCLKLMEEFCHQTENKVAVMKKSKSW